MQLNNTYHQCHWQLLLQQVQALAARLPCIGLSPDKLTLLPLDWCLCFSGAIKNRAGSMMYGKKKEVYTTV